MNDNKWEDLIPIDSIPEDLFIPGLYEFQRFVREEWKVCNWRPGTICDSCVHGHYDFRYRRTD